MSKTFTVVEAQERVLTEYHYYDVEADSIEQAYAIAQEGGLDWDRSDETDSDWTYKSGWGEDMEQAGENMVDHRTLDKAISDLREAEAAVDAIFKREYPVGTRCLYGPLNNLVEAEITRLPNRGGMRSTAGVRVVASGKLDRVYTSTLRKVVPA